MKLSKLFGPLMIALSLFITQPVFAGSVDKFVKDWNKATKKYNVDDVGPFNQLIKHLKEADKHSSAFMYVSGRLEKYKASSDKCYPKARKHVEKIPPLLNKKRDAASLKKVQDFIRNVKAEDIAERGIYIDIRPVAPVWKSIGVKLPKKTKNDSKKAYQLYKKCDNFLDLAHNAALRSKQHITGRNTSCLDGLTVANRLVTDWIQKGTPEMRGDFKELYEDLGKIYENVCDWNRSAFKKIR